MKTAVMTIFVLLMVAGPDLTQGQTGTVPWSSFNGGFAAAFAVNTHVTSMVGQAFAGTAVSANSGIKSGFLVYPFRAPLTSGVQPGGERGVPAVFDLSQNYPNPFNPKTGIRFQVAGVSEVKLVVYDLLGREVVTLVNERKDPGKYEVPFDGSGMASGVYIYRLTAGSFMQSRKMVLVK